MFKEEDVVHIILEFLQFLQIFGVESHGSSFGLGHQFDKAFGGVLRCDEKVFLTH